MLRWSVVSPFLSALPAILLGLTTVIAACSGEGPASSPPDASVAGCRPMPGTTGKPQTIPELVALLNGLPRPVTLPCFLESLDRPLSLVSTVNTVSAQPAEGPRSPRIFVLLGKLNLSLVPEGLNRDVLELGELWDDDLHSIKGEIHFPLDEALPDTAPLDRILDLPTQPKCSACHYPEIPVELAGYEHALSSPAFRPNPNFEAPLANVRHEHETCDAAAEPQRCAVYTALFGHGQVIAGAFSPQMPIFY